MNSNLNKIKSLCSAFLMLENEGEMQRFLDDLCTPQELRSLAERWEICQLLAQGTFTYREIQKMTKASLATITRVARFFKDERNNGYALVLEKIRRK